MFKVLDLFSGTQSVLKGLLLKGLVRNIDFEYYGIDIYSPEGENIILDLSQDDIVDKVIKVLPKDWKPDFIWASPVCNKFSVVNRMKNGNFYYEKTQNGLKPREDYDCKWPFNYENKNLEEARGDAILHLKLVDNMLKIIEYYDCDFVIENPLHSFMERLMPFDFKKNRADYCAYGFDYQKPTAIYSRYLLPLYKCSGDHEHKLSVQDMSNYARKSSVPPKLIEQILTIFFKE
jgi:hypothetical protein